MLRKIRERIQSEESGFTLIELLVVVLIIGILAAIAIPAFLGQRQKAQDASAKSDVRNALSAAEAFYSDSQTYVNLDTAALKKIEPSLGSNVSVVGSSTATDVKLTATSTSGNAFSITKGGSATAPTTLRSCTTTGSGACPSSGSW